MAIIISFNDSDPLIRGFSGASVTMDENAIHDETPSGRKLFALVDEDACVRTRVRDNSTSHLGGSRTFNKSSTGIHPGDSAIIRCTSIKGSESLITRGKVADAVIVHRSEDGARSRGQSP